LLLLLLLQLIVMAAAAAAAVKAWVAVKRHARRPHHAHATWHCSNAVQFL